MAAIPQKLSRSQGKFDLETALIPFKRREWVIFEIGRESLEPFELWAFPKNQHVMIYNDEIPFHWANGHSTKCVSQDPDEAIQEIVRIWRARFESKESSEDEQFTIEIGGKDD